MHSYMTSECCLQSTSTTHIGTERQQSPSMHQPTDTEAQHTCEETAGSPLPALQKRTRLLHALNHSIFECAQGLHHGAHGRRNPGELLFECGKVRVGPRAETNLRAQRAQMRSGARGVHALLELCKLPRHAACFFARFPVDLCLRAWIPCVDRDSQRSDPRYTVPAYSACDVKEKFLPDMTGASQAVTCDKMRARGKRGVFALVNTRMRTSINKRHVLQSNKRPVLRNKRPVLQIQRSRERAAERKREQVSRCARGGKRERGSEGAGKEREAAWGRGAVSFGGESTCDHNASPRTRTSSESLRRRPTSVRTRRDGGDEECGGRGGQSCTASRRRRQGRSCRV